jgi:hypothetical protein
MSVPTRTLVTAPITCGGTTHPCRLSDDRSGPDASAPSPALASSPVRPPQHPRARPRHRHPRLPDVPPGLPRAVSALSYLGVGGFGRLAHGVDGGDAVKSPEFTLTCSIEEAASAAYALLRSCDVANVLLALQLRRQIDQVLERRMDRVTPPTTVPAAGALGTRP